MKAFVLIACWYFLIRAIVDAPKNLSKTIYIEKQERALEQVIKFKRMFPDKLDATVGISFVWSFLLNVIPACCFFWIANYYHESTYIGIMCWLQIANVIFTLAQFPEAINELKVAIEDESLENFKIRRWHRLFAAVLDFAFYPVVIFLLMS